VSSALVTASSGIVRTLSEEEEEEEACLVKRQIIRAVAGRSGEEGEKDRDGADEPSMDSGSCAWNENDIRIACDVCSCAQWEKMS